MLGAVRRTHPFDYAAVALVAACRGDAWSVVDRRPEHGRIPEHRVCGAILRHEHCRRTGLESRLWRGRGPAGFDAGCPCRGVPGSASPTVATPWRVRDVWV